MNALVKKLSHFKGFPVVNGLLSGSHLTPSKQDLEGFLKAQRLAQKCAKEVAAFIVEGWTEKQATEMMTTWLRDHGVKNFFHFPYAWFGERSRFDGIRIHNYFEFMATDRVILPSEVYILDVAPIVDGYIADIGYTGCLGDNAAYDKAKEFLEQLKQDIVLLFKSNLLGGEIWEKLDKQITKSGYDNIHSMYPFSVLGHRVYKVSEKQLPLRLANFGWQSYLAILSRGIFGQLLNGNFEGDLTGLWAIEPHIGTKEFGAKFEELLVVTPTEVRWLENEKPTLLLS
jgi:Xaa-Pro aminopeptidase